MLSALYIENLAVIEKTYMEFSAGFSVFTGETGAGKSIVIDAINACLGQRTSREIVRSGTEKAVISAVFQKVPENVVAILVKNGYDASLDELVVERSIFADGHSSARINAKPAPIGLLRDIGIYLINIHGQHDNQVLLSPEKHLSILDSFGELEPELAQYQKKFAELRNLIRQLRQLTQNESQKEKRADLLRYQIEEIEEAKLSSGLEERLEQKSRRFRSVEKIAHALESACEALLGDEEDLQGAVDLVASAKSDVASISEFSEFAAPAETLESISLELSELAANLHSQLTALEYDQQEADFVESRLSQIHRLKMKYGSTVTEILDYLADAKKELSEIEHADEKIRKLNHQAVELKKQTAAIAAQLTEHRRQAAERFISRVAEEARFLEMPNLRLEARFTPVKLCSTGDIAVEFLISANLGEPPKPISKIVSGGELSRMMLAIKSALAEKDEIGTLIFDEIDTGVSGRAAQKIGLKLREVAASRQVLCVTHSAQVAALGHNHFLIQKKSEQGRTYTNVIPLDFDGRILEIARIMGTDNVTNLASEAAKKMLLDAGK